MKVAGRLHSSPEAAVRFVSIRGPGRHWTESSRTGRNVKGLSQQRLSDFYYSWGSAAADFNHDDILDVVSGRYITTDLTI